jgi:dTDP-4-amino-4,6-dideoxygalactose transaminase
MELERRIAALAGVRNCVLVANGTVGLELLIRALGLRGEVIVPAFTFVATAHALQWQEITAGIRRHRSRDALSGSAQR